MLETQMWMQYAPELMTEWRQAMEEGKDVVRWKTVCEEIVEKAKEENCEAAALQIRHKLIHAPIRADYAYEEPSKLEDIKAARPKRRHEFTNTLSKDGLMNKISGAWIGRIGGCLLGKPVEGYRREKLYTLLKDTDNYPMHKYIYKRELTPELMEKIDFEQVEPWLKNCFADMVKDAAPADDDTNYTVFAMKLIEEYGKDFRPNDVLEAWLNWIPMFSTCTAERMAYRNAAMGMYAPETANYNNPYREWIGAQIRGDFFGYMNPADTEKAAEMAWRDASISHVKNGIYGEMFIAAMLAAAAVCDNVKTVIEAGLDEIPAKCRLRKDIEKVLGWHSAEVTELEAIERIHEQYDEFVQHDWCHTNSNAMIVAMALLYGKKDFGKSICLAVQAAFDTDCNGATVGSIVGMLVGEKNIPPYWYQCYNRKLVTSISGYNLVSVEMLAEKTISLMDSK